MFDNKIILANNLKHFMKMKSKTQIDIADQLKVSQSTVSDWINGNKYPRIDKLQQLADYFDVLKSDLSESKPMERRNRVDIKNDTLYLNVPIYPPLSCGSGMFVNDNIEDYISFTDRLLNPNNDYFCQVASGDSMIDENIQDGDLLVFEKTSVIQNGQIGCFCIDENMATCKKFYKDDASAIITLQPANKTYPPIIVTVETMNFHVVGKLALVINKR